MPQSVPEIDIFPESIHSVSQIGEWSGGREDAREGEMGSKPD